MCLAIETFCKPALAAPKEASTGGVHHSGGFYFPFLGQCRKCIGQNTQKGTVKKYDGLEKLAVKMLPDLVKKRPKTRLS
jgi:hypothetical protein